MGSIKAKSKAKTGNVKGSRAGSGAGSGAPSVIIETVKVPFPVLVDRFNIIYVPEFFIV